jgi:hypothetical protein
MIMKANVMALRQADRAVVNGAASIPAVPASIPSAVADFIRSHRIAQITFMPESENFRDGWSVVIGNNRYFGDTIEEAVGKAQ